MASVGRGSRSKGSNFERKIVKSLSDWWGFTFQRTPGSGSLHTWSAENNVAGDVVAGPSSRFPYVVECKKHEGWTIENLFLNNLTIKEWFSQVVSDSRRVGRVPMLIFSRNRAKEFVMLPYDEEVYQILVMRHQQVMRTVVTIKDELTLKEESFDVMVFLLEGLITFDPEYLIDLHTNYDWEDLTLIEFPDEQEEEEDLSAEEMANDVMKKLKP